MEPVPLEVFETSLPQIRAAWIHALRDEPALSALGRPETVGFLMDATFLQVIAGLRATETGIPWLAHLLPVAGSVHTYLACGVTGIKKYYGTGERAIRAVLGPIPGSGAEDTIALFNDIAQREVWAMCNTCDHRDSRCCQNPTVKKDGPSP